MVRRRSSLIRASHSVDPDHHHAIVLDGIRASFIAPCDRHAALMAMHHEHDVAPSDLLSSFSAKARPLLASFSQNQDPARPRFSWMKAPSLKSVVTDGTHESDMLVGEIKGYDTSRQEQDEEANIDDNGDVYPKSDREIWTARFYLLLTAVLYGTSYPIVKILDDNMPVPISLTLRFGMASIVTIPWLFESPAIDWNSSFQASMRGIEIGLWDCAGFLAQAIALTTTAANKVRIRVFISRANN